MTNSTNDDYLAIIDLDPDYDGNGKSRPEETLGAMRAAAIATIISITAWAAIGYTAWTILT